MYFLHYSGSAAARFISRMTENIRVEMKIDDSCCDGKQMWYPAGTTRVSGRGHMDNKNLDRLTWRLSDAYFFIAFFAAYRDTHIIPLYGSEIKTSLSYWFNWVLSVCTSQTADNSYKSVTILITTAWNSSRLSAADITAPERGAVWSRGCSPASAVMMVMTHNDDAFCLFLPSLSEVGVVRPLMWLWTAFWVWFLVKPWVVSDVGLSPPRLHLLCPIGTNGLEHGSASLLGKLFHRLLSVNLPQSLKNNVFPVQVFLYFSSLCRHLWDSCPPTISEGT